MSVLDNEAVKQVKDRYLSNYLSMVQSPNCHLSFFMFGRCDSRFLFGQHFSMSLALDIGIDSLAIRYHDPVKLPKI